MIPLLLTLAVIWTLTLLCAYGCGYRAGEATAVAQARRFISSLCDRVKAQHELLQRRAGKLSPDTGGQCSTNQIVPCQPMTTDDTTRPCTENRQVVTSGETWQLGL